MQSNTRAIRRFIPIKLIAFLYTCLWLFPANGICQAPDDCSTYKAAGSFLDAWVGDWTGKGTITGDPVVYDVSANWVLDSQFIALSLSDTAKTPAYQAHVYFGFLCEEKMYVAHWIDSFGPEFSKTPGIGTLNGQSLPLLFAYPDGDFINTFTYDEASDTWTSISKFRGDDNMWQTFGEIIFTRKM